MGLAERGQPEQQAGEPKNANAFYWQAYALGRYSQGISVAKALAQLGVPHANDLRELTAKVEELSAQVAKLTPASTPPAAPWCTAS